MIRFSLHCGGGHSFEAWFRSNDDYDLQRGKQLINCPVCNSTVVEKTLMAPAIATSHAHMPAVSAPAAIFREWQRLAKKLRESADHVGARFVEEARKIHFGEADPRAIYGNASAQDVAALLDDGIDVLPLPALPEEQN